MGSGNNPKTALIEYLEQIDNNDIRAEDGSLLKLKIDHKIENKLLITVATNGYLKRV